ncbi:MAG: UvrD-helicase domain-containing protein, partial [Deltaproteobacteria bacterium]|nr:UvrD-helicase domain-containing protein [Deltaproteobacteria bacterium]
MTTLAFNQLQQEAINHLHGPMMVLSSAGSGKTAVLTQRVITLIEEKGLNPYNLLAITFSKKAVLEILARLKLRLNGTSEQITISTFHSLGFRILKAANYPMPSFRIIQNGEQANLISEATKAAKVSIDLQTIQKQISLAKNDLLSPADLESSSKEDDKATAKVFKEYELLKRRRRLLDF